jgi:hypothetical protein
MQRSFLAIYLRDHHAAGVAGTRLARRVADQPATTVDLSAVASEILEDLASLETIMGTLGVDPDGTKDALARIGERLGRLKPNGRLRGRSPLSDVVELETLLVGITGKRALWLSLRASAAAPRDVLDRLVSQAKRLESVAPPSPVTRVSDRDGEGARARHVFGGSTGGDTSGSCQPRGPVYPRPVPVRRPNHTGDSYEPERFAEGTPS